MNMETYRFQILQNRNRIRLFALIAPSEDVSGVDTPPKQAGARYCRQRRQASLIFSAMKGDSATPCSLPGVNRIYHLYIFFSGIHVVFRFKLVNEFSNSSQGVGPMASGNQPVQPGARPTEPSRKGFPDFVSPFAGRHLLPFSPSTNQRRLRARRGQRLRKRGRPLIGFLPSSGPIIRVSQALNAWVTALPCIFFGVNLHR